MVTELSDNVRRYRRRAGMSQEELAHTAGVSPGTVRKAEQGGTLGMETLHTLARALRVTTAALMASDAPEPVGRAEEPNRVNLIQLRAALTPAVGLVDQDVEAMVEEPNLRTFRRTLQDARVLHFSDSYKSVAAQLPGLLRDAAQAVAYYDSGDEHRQALLARAEALRLPVTVAVKALEDSLVIGDARAVVRKAGGQEELSPRAWKRLGRPSTNDGNRFTLDVARAHARTGDLSAAMDELTRAREAAPQWLRHQNGAAETMQEILRKRKRTLTTEMREMADYLGVVG
ncbi:helix-turn-helix domain-containing protein [Streptomyces sp. NBC_01014]|uniref:helix-turn-helix domain-containing protein n=1 Tax=Streptomyces sp. NBC_01014 TaxID=2903719 RepID=UPI003868E323|nr:helix-turn-helix domain-containing protein [Streptomyces sp. NBC_01014]